MHLKNTEIFAIAFFFLSIFSFMGWFFAETDNQILREELAMLEYSKPSITEGKYYDR